MGLRRKQAAGRQPMPRMELHDAPSNNLRESRRSIRNSFEMPIHSYFSVSVMRRGTSMRLEAHDACCKILEPYRKCAGAVQPREPRVCPAGALAIGGFGRSRWRGGRGGSMGFAWAIRDLFVEQLS